jgi:hypothetical protein
MERKTRNGKKRKEKKRKTRKGKKEKGKKKVWQHYGKKEQKFM